MDGEEQYDEEDYGSCGRCGCNLDKDEAFDGVCGQCSWWIEQVKGAADQ
jgi:hypothetical protein